MSFWSSTSQNLTSAINKDILINIILTPVPDASQLFPFSQTGSEFFFLRWVEELIPLRRKKES
jgi:hypothetical protein